MPDIKQILIDFATVLMLTSVGYATMIAMNTFINFLQELG